MTFFDDFLSDEDAFRLRARERARAAVLNLLISARDKKGLSHTDIARFLDINKSTISRDINTLANFTVDKLADYGRVLGLELSVDFVPPFEIEEYEQSGNGYRSIKQNRGSNTIAVTSLDSVDIPGIDLNSHSTPDIKFEAA